jgi:hypothetical protein
MRVAVLSMSVIGFLPSLCMHNIDRRRRQLGGEEVVPSAGTSSTVIERRPYGSGVLQLEKRGESGPYWYFHHRKEGKQMTVYLGKTDAPEIKLAQIKGGIGG